MDPSGQAISTEATRVDISFCVKSKCPGPAGPVWFIYQIFLSVVYSKSFCLCGKN